MDYELSQAFSQALNLSLWAQSSSWGLIVELVCFLPAIPFFTFYANSTINHLDTETVKLRPRSGPSQFQVRSTLWKNAKPNLAADKIFGLCNSLNMSTHLEWPPLPVQQNKTGRQQEVVHGSERSPKYQNQNSGLDSIDPSLVEHRF